MPNADDRLYRLVGERVLQHRVKAGLTQHELAKQVGLKRTSITNLEKGRQRLPLHVLLAVAEALDLELRELVPTRVELASELRVPVKVGDTEAVVPPMTARLINRLMEKKR